MILVLDTQRFASYFCHTISHRLPKCKFEEEFLFNLLPRWILGDISMHNSNSHYCSTLNASTTSAGIGERVGTTVRESSEIIDQISRKNIWDTSTGCSSCSHSQIWQKQWQKDLLLPCWRRTAETSKSIISESCPLAPTQWSSLCPFGSGSWLTPYFDSPPLEL